MGRLDEYAPDVMGRDGEMYITVVFPRKIESHKAEDDAGKGLYPCGDIHDKRPPPWPLSGVYLPFEVKGGEKFPSTQGIN